MRPALLRIVLVLAGACVLVVGAVFAPLGLRQISAFNVQRVEVVGVRYLATEDVVAAAGISAASNIFDDATSWIDALLRHPLVAHAEIERRVPDTVRLLIRETTPVAFARTPELRAIDEHGRVLPADPAAEGMDLPVLLVDTRLSAAGRAADPATRRLAVFLGIVQREEPGLLGWISEVGVHGDAVRLVLRSAADAVVLVPAEPAAERLRELHLTLADLATPRYAAHVPAPATADTTTDTTAAATVDGALVARSIESELSQVSTIDGRYHDQIVVALHRGRK